MSPCSGGVTGGGAGADGNHSYLAYMTAPVNSTGGTIEVRLAADAVMDMAGNNNTLRATVQVPYDYLAPTVTMRLAGAVGVVGRCRLNIVCVSKE